MEPCFLRESDSVCNSLSLQAKGFHGEIEDLQQWLTDTERHLLASKPLGGLPETAREQLNAHMVCIVLPAALASDEQTDYFAGALGIHKSWKKALEDT